MKCKLSTNDFRIIDDKLYVLGQARITEMDFNEKINFRTVPKRKFKVLSNADYFDISPDKKTIAVKNTSGHIAVYDYNSGELLLKNTCTRREGDQIHYINNHQIISTDWDSKLIMLDINTNEWKQLYDFGVDETQSRRKTVDSIFRVSQNEFLVVKDQRYLYFIYVDENKFEIIYEYQFVKPYNPGSRHGIIMECLGKIRGDILITGRNLKIEDHYELCAMFFNFRKREVEKIVRIKKIIGFRDSYIEGIDVSTDLKNLVFSCKGDGLLEDNVFIVDLEDESNVKKLETQYFSQVSYCFDNKKILIGTWNDLSLMDESNFNACENLPMQPEYRNLLKEFQEILMNQIKNEKK